MEKAKPTPYEFFAIIDAIDDEFINDRVRYLTSYIEGNFYIFKDIATEEMFINQDFKKNKYVQSVPYLLPCFAIFFNETIEVLWLHKRIRNMGIGKKIIEILKPKYVLYPLKSAMYFWKKTNLEIKGTVVEN